jgi:AraC-like DNA-binding protein
VSAVLLLHGVTPTFTARVVALVDDLYAYERLSVALRGHARLERAEDWKAFAELIKCLPTPIVVFGLSVGSPSRIESTLREIRRAALGIKIVLLCTLDTRSLDMLLRVHVSLVDDLVVPAVHDLSTMRRRILARPDRRVAVIQLRALLTGCVAAPLVPMLEWCLSEAEQGNCRQMTVGGMSRDIGRSRIEVERRFARVCIATPHDLIAWTRVLLAVQFLATRRRGLAAIAADIGLSSAGALGRLVKRKTGLTSGEIRQHGITRVICMFQDDFRRQDEMRSSLSSGVQRSSLPTGVIPGVSDNRSAVESFPLRRARQL